MVGQGDTARVADGRQRALGCGTLDDQVRPGVVRATCDRCRQCIYGAGKRHPAGWIQREKHTASRRCALRLRVPAEFAGKMSKVTVGGTAWTTFDAKAETVDFAAASLTPAVLTGMQTIGASFA